MKKIVFLAGLVLLLSSAVYAELDDYRRYFEFGVEAEAGASNNYFTAKDTLVKDLVIDLDDMTDSLSDKGLVIDFDVNFKNYIAINTSEKFRLRVFWGITGNGYGNISKELFEMLSGGFGQNTEENVDINLFGDVYAEAGVSYKTKIRDWGVRFTPSLFAPLLHVSETRANATYISNESGLIRAQADIPVDIYSAISLEDIDDVTVDSAYVQDALGKIVKGVGFDFGGGIERKFTKTLDAGIFTRVPVVPGRLGYKSSRRYWATFEETNLLGALSEVEDHSYDHGETDAVYSKETKWVNRPFILGAECAWRPFGSWATFRPRLNLAVRNPFSSEYQVYGEYSIAADFIILKVLGFKLATAYENLVFRQTFGIMINARVIEIDAYVQSRGADFGKSFDLSGAAGYVGLKFGW